MRADQRTFVADNQLLERIQELVIGWLKDVKPLLLAGGVPPEVVNAADQTLAELVRLTALRSRRLRYIALLTEARRVLVQQLLLEVARLPAAASAPAPPQLIPEIPDLPNELIPPALLGWVTQMRDFLRKSAFDRNVFIMVAYRSHLNPLIKRVKE